MPSSPGPSIDRIATASASAALERLAGSDLVERGCVTVISVEAIAERAGDRWPRRRDDVWAYVDRKLHEHLGHQDMRQRLTDTDFLIAMPHEEGVAAQAISLKILEEIIVFFLGSAELTDLRVRSVTRIDGLSVSATELDPARVAVARQRAGDGPSPYSGGLDPGEERRRNPVSFVASGGQKVSVHFALEHVVSLRHNVTAALRIQPIVRRASTGRLLARSMADFTDDEVAFIDGATQDFASLFLPQDARSQPPLIVPTSFRSLGGRKGRRDLVSRTAGAPGQLRRAVFVEIVDVDRGTPPGRLAEVAALVTDLTRGVMVRLPTRRDVAHIVRDVRLKGLTFDMGGLPPAEPRLARAMLTMAAQAKGLAPALIVQGLPSAEYFPIAQVGGFTHAARRAAAACAEVQAPAA